MNKKIFLLPNSITSMAAAHAKIYEDKKEYVLRVSDCHNSIKLWGKTDTEQAINEGIEKLENLINVAAELKQVLKGKEKQLKANNGEVQKLALWVSIELQNNNKHLEAIANRNKVREEDVNHWIVYDKPEILKPYNINLIAELLNIQPHEVWE